MGRAWLPQPHTSLTVCAREQLGWATLTPTLGGFFSVGLGVLQTPMVRFTLLPFTVQACVKTASHVGAVVVSPHHATSLT